MCKIHQSRHQPAREQVTSVTATSTALSQRRCQELNLHNNQAYGRKSCSWQEAPGLEHVHNATVLVYLST